MNVRVVIALCFTFAAAVNCQYDNRQLIDQTQHLQDVEKYGQGVPHVDPRYYSIYPNLANASNINDGLGQKFNSSVGGFDNSVDGFNTTKPAQNSTNNSNFYNKTMSGVSNGICVQEVPTASLLGPNDVTVNGNGSDPTLSRISVCCEGYQRNVHNFRKCDPLCSNGCVNGICTAPERCECYPDHVRNLGGFCLPTCPIGCGNGFCNPDKSCSCKSGFQLDQSGKFCAPKCTMGCENGNCTAPEECTCSKGFSLSPSTFECEPACSKGCANGVCVGPEQCVCNKGFVKVNDHCQPFCSKGCQNGQCVAPEVCQCPGNGWSLDPTGAKCVPSCDKNCLNGVCSGPNQCTCRNGYAADVLDPFRCNPKCDPPCSNGICSGPNLCLCHQGYVKDRSAKTNNICIKS